MADPKSFKTLFAQKIGESAIRGLSINIDFDRTNKLYYQLSLLLYPANNENGEDGKVESMKMVNSG